MIYSMTAFARTDNTLPNGKITFELRSVNHRFLDINFRLPDTWRELEPIFRDILRTRVSRGKVDVTLRLEEEENQYQLVMNEAVVTSLFQLHDKLQQFSKNIAPINTLELLKWPSVLKENNTLTGTLQSEIVTYFNHCIDALLAMREREGEALLKIISSRLQACLCYVDEIKTRYPLQITSQRTRLKEKLAELSSQLDPARLEQEMILWLQRFDIAEEVDRLSTHIQEFKRILEAKGQIGRRMDFLLQEMNREANTMASKSIDSAIQHAVVEIKVLLEQIREQVQNIE